MDHIIEKLTRHTCGELSCEECNAQREAAAAEIASLRDALNDLHAIADAACGSADSDTQAALALDALESENAKARELLAAQAVAEVINALDKSLSDELYTTPPGGLEKYWHFRWRKGWSAEHAMYEFSDQLAYYAAECRRWEEHHNGITCVVERVRDKYLMPKIREFMSALANAKITQPGPVAPLAGRGSDRA